ncbi:hypothetical protein OJF2_35490 [Aquisphaera giovannonii]|uniref:Uncharacterized protein n=1 Tax=Aquisphaera giovannonii TaxID=406548 RepID=A0A5B9W423_9BACT|nr:hypothetical protein [Aquisphaera giovannonii]QEH35004.1 hypothetical protein OJF2_35490 [Aquisphaera giovannonii]
MTSSASLRGIVRGRTIELESESGLPDGQVVSVTLTSVGASSLAGLFATPPHKLDPRLAEALSKVKDLPPGEGLRRSAGAWAEDAAELDEYLEENRRRRKIGRPEIEP